jgi:type VI secretion system protein ImpE
MKIDAPLAQVLARITDGCRARPTDASLRMQLFRLLCVTGQWARAEAALDVAGRVDASLALTVLAHRNALACERFREQVFLGRRAPLFVGEPGLGAALLAQALALEPQAALAARERAFDEISASSGTIDATRFEWLADADSRLGPNLEVYLDGKYFWVPFERIARLDVEAPDDALDLVWCRVELTLKGGVPQPAIVPTRYPGTAAIDDDALRLARRTEWVGIGGEHCAGRGQRCLAFGDEDRALLDVRRVEFD